MNLHIRTLILFILLQFVHHNIQSQVYYDDWPITVNTNNRNKLDTTLIGPQYVPIGTQWEHPIITYFFQNGTNDITGTDEHQAVRDALRIWALETELAFLEVCDAADADIVILWGTFAHGDPVPPCYGGAQAFNGPGNVLAHVLGGPPPNTCGGLAGDIHFDDSETWTLDIRTNDLQPIDLVTVAAHEIGHSLGLHHTTFPGSLMLPAYTGSFRFLGQDDKAGIHSIYGKKTGTSIFTGERVFCSSATYAMTNDLPPGVTVTSWSASPSSGVSISGSGNSRTLTRIGSFNNEVTLRATIANACAEVEVERKVWIGVPAIESVDFRNGSEHQGYFCSSQYGNEFKFSTYGDYATSMDMFEVQLLSYPGMAVLHTQTAVGGEGTLTYTPPGLVHFASPHHQPSLWHGTMGWL